MNRQIDSAMAPGIQQHDRVVLFDGVCRLCSAWVRFLLRFDTQKRFKLSAVQSPEGKAILEWYGLPTDCYETMLLVEGPIIYKKSTAFFRVMVRLPFPWPMVCIFWLIPYFIRDWMYDCIALNRYALFGRYDVCVIPNKDHEGRFLGG